MTQVYLDANADSPVHPAAWDAYVEAAALCADTLVPNPLGRDAKQRLQAAQEKVARQLGADADELVFTSGGTEADALALQGLVEAGAHVVTSSIEHPAVQKGVAALVARGSVTATVVAAGRDGRVQVDAIAAALLPSTRLVSIVLACNETGVVQPVQEIAALCRARGVLVHTDAVQALGRLAVDCHALGVDALSFAGHKVGAVGGVGGLVIRRGVALNAPFGAPESTPNLPGIASLACALEHVAGEEERRAWAARRDRLEGLLRRDCPDVEILGLGSPRLCNTSCVRFPGREADGLLMALDLEGVRVSMGSACSSGAIEPSPILLGMSLSRREAREALRFSLPRHTTDAQIDDAVAALVRILRRSSST